LSGLKHYKAECTNCCKIALN